MVISGIASAGRLQSLLESESDDKTSGLVWAIVFLVVDVFVGISVAALAITQASQVSCIDSCAWACCCKIHDFIVAMGV